MAAQSGIDLSGLILWDASARGPDVALLRDLGALSREELVAVDLDVFGPMEGMDPYGNRERSAPDIELVVHTIRLDKAKVPFPDWFRFAVIEQGGCWWLRIP